MHSQVGRLVPELQLRHPLSDHGVQGDGLFPQSGVTWLGPSNRHSRPGKNALRSCKRHLLLLQETIAQIDGSALWVLGGTKGMPDSFVPELSESAFPKTREHESRRGRQTHI